MAYLARYALVTLLLASACNDPGEMSPVSAPVSPSLPEQYFTSVKTIKLEENDDVINVVPAVAVRRDGNAFLVVDLLEARARLYRPDGTLERQFGTRGGGPGEFRRPLTGFWDAERLVIADMGSGVLQFSAPGVFSHGGRPPLQPLYGAFPLTSSTALLGGRRPPPGGRGRATLLHVWDLRADSLVHSFFPTPGDSVLQVAARNFGWVGAAVVGDTIAAVFALSDTLYFFDRTGRAGRRIPLPIRSFRPMRAIPPEASDPVRRNQWLSKFLFLNSVFPLPDGGFLVQYERPAGTESRWNLLRLDRDGSTRFDVQDTPRLLAVHQGELIFQSPESPTPSQWLIARLR